MSSYNTQTVKDKFYDKREEYNSLVSVEHIILSLQGSNTIRRQKLCVSFKYATFAHYTLCSNYTFLTFVQIG